MSAELSYDTTNRINRVADPMFPQFFYEIIFDAINTPTIIIEEDTTISLVNNGFEKLSGYPRDEVEGKKSLKDFIKEDCWKKMETYHKLRRIDPKKAPERYECLFIDRDGGVKNAHVSISMIPETNKSVANFLDVTDQVRAQEALQESETKFRLLFEKSADAFLILDGNRYIDCNEATCKIMHCTKEQIIGLNPVRISPEKQPDGQMSSEKAKEILERALKEGSCHFEWVHRNFDNELIWVEVSLTAISIGGKKYLYATGRDITRRKQVEEALRESEERYKTAIEHSNDGVMIVKDEKYIFVNQKLVQMLGYSKAEEIVGKHIRTLVHPDCVGMVVDRHRRRHGGGDDVPARYELKHVRKDGTSIDVEASVTKTIYKGESVSLIYLRDITERKKADEALKNREKELKIKSMNLEETNAALNVLLKLRENDKKMLENQILANIKELVLPYLEKMKKGHLNENQATYLNILESGLNDIISPFIQNLTSNHSAFTPTEIRIANLIRNGNTSKEIAQLLNVSRGTVDTHRNSIRRKLKLDNKKVNLRSHLLSV